MSHRVWCGCCRKSKLHSGRFHGPGNQSGIQTKAPGAKGFNEHRRLLESKDVDAVLIATPDHWHAGCAIDALNAGKDVYVEKPLTLKIEEGPAIVKAARVNNRICQVGMQQRSGSHYLEAKEKFFKSGKLGKIQVIVWCGRRSLGSVHKLPAHCFAAQNQLFQKRGSGL